MKIITLIENLVYKSGLLAEHGLSFLIDTGKRKILFDTGQSPAFLSNAKKLDVDIMEIDAVVISHGHFDHTGGLYEFLKVNKKAVIYAKKEIFKEKFKDEQFFIGTPHNPADLKDRIIYIRSTTELDPCIYLLPDIPIINPADTSFTRFNIHTTDGFIQDEFQDELFLVIKRKKKLNVLSSCSHRGISNILRAATEQFHLPVQLVLGGFHLKDAGADQYNAVSGYIKQADPESIGVCHCTGVDKYLEIKSEFGNKVFYNMTGNHILI